MQEQPTSLYPANTGPHANLGEDEKKKRLDAIVRVWQSDTEKRSERDGYRAFLQASGLDEYRYAVWLRFPEWEHAAVVGQVISLGRSESGAPEDPTLFTSWRRDILLKTLPDWKIHLPDENVFNISVRITPGSLGEGTKWAMVMPKELIPRYRPGWPTQSEWVSWTRQFDWLSLAVPFIRAMLDSPEKA
ncbi:MAG: hypothetical protein ABI234_16720 [Ktedonobacteraceae bacterium]